MYHQVQGTAMGTKMAPSYANIFMAELEEKLLSNYPKKPLLWLRYIDDILCIWPGPQSEMDLNQAHPTIKFTCESSTNRAIFLDLTIYKGKRHATSLILDMEPFFKPTNKFQYLEYSSAHPRGTFASLVKGELTRLLRACSSGETYKNVSDKLFKEFKTRGYPNHLLQKTLQEVPFQNRTKLLCKEKNEKQTYDTFFKVKHTPDLDTKLLRKILKPTDQEEELVPNPCLSLSKSDNLAKKVSQSQTKTIPKPTRINNPNNNPDHQTRDRQLHAMWKPKV